jgi:hypothetical protein
MAGFRSISPNININTQSGQLRTELLNTFTRLDGQLSQAPYRLATQNGPVGNSGAADTDLMATLINFGTLTQIGASIQITACGKSNANANDKTFKVLLAGVEIFTSGAIKMNDKDWVYRGEIVFNGGSSQICHGTFSYDGGSPVVDTRITSVNLANNALLKFTGLGSVSDDISLYYYKTLLIN